MTSNEHNISFTPVLDQVFPRLLSQACRDKNSPFYGCFDRNWWHYRIRDFASIMLQQGGYSAFEYAKLTGYSEYKDELVALARGSALFWNKRAKKRGAFEEYYPWEQGYPPLAFATLAMSKLVLEGVVETAEVWHGLKKAGRQLSRRFEHQAGNQQVAGLAALAAIRKIDPTLVKEEDYLKQKAKTLELQDEEGWYTEYDGPDLGYLSVTLDCLWDLFDITGEEDYINSAKRGLVFLHDFVALRGAGAGMHNARNTDYIVPYGICRFLSSDESKHKDQAKLLMELLYGNLECRKHFFHAVDDRYWSHYIGHSVVRAEQLLMDNPLAKGKSALTPHPTSFEKSGYIFKSIPGSEYRLLVSPRKGGILSVFNNEQEQASDYGWVVFAKGKQLVNHWWSDQWTWEEEENKIVIRGKLFPHSEKTSKPYLHFGLRLVSFVFGSKLTGLLRNILIFKSKSSKIGFTRTIELGDAQVIIHDEFSNLDEKANVQRAPRTSKRHVASADSWHKEDFSLNITETTSTNTEKNRQGSATQEGKFINSTVISVNETLS